MKVTIVCDVPGSGNNGTTLAMTNLATSLRAKGHTVRILSPDKEKEGQEDYFIVPSLHFGALDHYVEENCGTLAAADDDVIRASFEGVDVVHIMTPFVLGRRALKIAREMGLPVSAGYHIMAENITVHVHMMNAPLANKVVDRELEHFYARVDAIHFPTQFIRDRYESTYGPTNGYVISNGVSEYVTPREVEKPAAYADRFVILSTGRYCGEKAQSVLIDAIAQSKHEKDIQLILAGTGPLEKKLSRLGGELTNPPVLQFYSREEMTDVLNYADLYVHPAEIELEGIACLEAIACGLVPVISNSEKCATRFYAPDERCLFEHGNPENLAEKIDFWMEHPTEKAELSQQLIDYAGEKFKLSKCMDRMEEMLLETIEKKKAGEI